MLLHTTLLTLLSTVALGGAPADTTGSVEGVVTGLHGSGTEPVSHANVELFGAWGTESSQTDEHGRYELSEVPAGTAILRVRHLGFESHVVEVEVRAGKTLSLDLELRSRPVALEPVYVGRRPVEPMGTAYGRTGRAEQSMEVETTAAQLGMADPGLVAAARNVPPDDPEGPGEVLFMRGSTTDLRRVLLDGVPVFSPFHVAGLLPSFHGDLLGEAGAYVGGAPARYDGSIAQVLDLRTRSPRRDRYRVGGSMDGMSGRLTLEGPIGPSGGIALAGRMLHDLQPRLLDDGRSPYGYRDALLRVEERFAVGHRLSLTGFWNRESVRLDPQRAEERIAEEGLMDASGKSAAPSEAVWSNRAASLRYAGRWGSTWVNATAGRSLYQAALPLDLDNPVFVRGWTQQRRFGLDLARSSGSWDVRTGGSMEWTGLTFQAPGMGGGVSGSGGPEDDSGESSVLSSPEPTGAFDVPSPDEEDVVGTAAASVGAYLEGRRPLGEEFAVTFGGRVEYFTQGGEIHLSPRASGEWRLTEDAVLTVTGGRYHQLVPADDDAAVADALGRSNRLGAGAWTPGLKVASGSHLVTSLGQNLTRRLRLDISGFAKRFEGLPQSPEGRVNTSGMDLRVTRSGERLGGWLGYKLGWFWSGGGENRDFAGRHLLAGGLAGSLGGWADARLSTVYGAGLPYTGVPLVGDNGASSDEGGGIRALSSPTGVDEGTPLAVEPMDDFLRVDLEVTSEWEMELRGRNTSLRPYLKVLNALDRRDALFIYFDEWRDEDARPVAERPLIPLLGVEWSF